MVVALLGPREDPQVTTVADALDERGTEWEVWDADGWPGAAPLSMTVSSGTATVVEEPVDVDRITSVYLRRISLDPRGPGFENELESRPYSLVNQLREYRGLLTSILTHLDRRGVPVVNPPETQSVHGCKPSQLAAFEAADLPVPETVATNDPDAATAFVERVGDAVYKPVGGGGHARSITPEDLGSRRLDRLSNAPVLFQERLDGADYRLFVVDGDVVATGQIRSDELDYRLGDHEVAAASLSDEIERAAVRAADVLDLRFAGVDVVAGDDGFGVLEANPSPMFAAFDRQAGTDVAGHLAAHLDR